MKKTIVAILLMLGLTIPQDIQCAPTGIEELKIATMSMAFWGIIIYGGMKLIGNPSTKRLLSIRKDLQACKKKHKKALHDLRWYAENEPEKLQSAHNRAQWSLYELKSYMMWLIGRWNAGFVNGFPQKLKNKLGDLVTMDINDYILFSEPETKTVSYEMALIIKIDEFIEDFTKRIEIYGAYEREQAQESRFKFLQWRIPTYE